MKNYGNADFVESQDIKKPHEGIMYRTNICGTCQ